jgi:antitoxin MazE
MTETILTIKRWGNGMGVRLPQAVAREAQLCAGQQVCLVIEAGRLIV